MRLLVTLLFLLLIVALNRCGPPTLPAVSPTAEATLAQVASARLRIEVLPAGAAVLVDGLRSGATPVSIELSAGQHTIRVELAGYAPLDQTVDLAAGEEAVMGGELTPLAPTVTLAPTLGLDVEPSPTETPEAPPLPDLAVVYVRIELETGGACDYASTHLGLTVGVQNIGEGDAGPFLVQADGCQQQVEGLAAGQTISLWFAECGAPTEHQVVVDAASEVQETDKENNRFAGQVPIPTLPPTCTPPPAEPPTSTPAPPPPAAVTLREARIAIPTYPYADFVTMGWNETFRMPYAILDREAYEASNPAPVDATYRLVVVENEYLKLTFLPEVGGRLYEVVFKPTGHRETYRNPVLKPSPWGPPEQGWWLAAGGIEWCLPVEEHGYEWGAPWQLQASRDARGVTITLRDTEADDRLRAAIAVRLEAGAAYFTIRPRLENPTGAPLAVKYWTNAMLAPGGGNAPSADLRFVLPKAVTAVTVHSRGDDGLPGPNERMAWPVFQGVDFSRLGDWNRWLGFFEDPAAGGFMAVYDEGRDEGMIRVFPAETARGAKGFAFGWNDPIPAYHWTDDGSSYVELHGGPAPTFDESVTLPAGGHLQWTETWYPVAGLGGLRYANGAAALNLTAGGGQAQAVVAVTRPWSGDLVLLLNGGERWRQAVSLRPGQPFQAAVPLGGDAPQTGRLTLRLEAAQDRDVVAEYSADYNLK